MKIWQGYGSEHSMNLRMIGHFKEHADAVEAKEIIDALSEQLRADEQAGLTKVGTPSGRYTEGMEKVLKKHDFYIIGSAELDQFAYDVSVDVECNNVVISTDEIDVSAFMKVLIHKGARVEVYSAHEHPEKETET